MELEVGPLDWSRESVSLTLRGERHSVAKNVQLHSAQRAVARDADDRKAMLNGNLVAAVREAYRDILVLEARELHGDAWREHCDVRAIPPFERFIEGLANVR